jgi:GNAT superfamily N-acetyltransferase
MIQVVRVPSDHLDFITLIKLLDQNLAITDGEDHAFYDKFNKLTSIKHTLIGYEDTIPVCCGAIKLFQADAFEIKRMFTIDTARGNAYAVVILKHLETWAQELGATRCVLETGINQHAAIALYKKCGYQRTPNYGQYQGIAQSFCFEKIL